MLQRQNIDRAPWIGSTSLARALEYDQDLLSMDFRREVHLWLAGQAPLVVKSDGRLDESEFPSVAQVMVDPVMSQKICLVAVVPTELCELWFSL